MQKNIVKLSVALLSALLISSLSACSDGGGDEKLNGGAVLSSISVAGYPVTTIPTPIPARDWNDEEVLLSGLGAEYTTQLVVKTAAELTSAAVVVEASAGAKLQYAVELSASKPGADAFSNNATVALSPNNYLYIRVTSEDGKTINYYRIRVTTESADKNLTSVTIGTVSVTTLGTPADTYAQAVAGTVALTNEQNSSVAVTAVPSNASATVKYAKVSGDSAPTFADSLTTDFADGDFVYIEVTAQNGVDKNIYKIEVQIGRNANLSGLTIGDASVTNLGVPAASVADTIAGGFLFGTSNADNVTVAATPADGAATVKYAKATGDAAPTFDDTSTFSFNDQDFLYIEVTAANTTTKLVYKIQVNLQQKATIKYGTPDITQKGDDSIWDGLTEYNINKVFPADSTTAYIAAPDTSGVAKALFDEDGLWVYVQVTDPNIHTTPATANQHLYDSVELFINENVAVKNMGYASQGGQYRLGALDEVSGDPTAAVTAFNALNKHTAWITDNGYAVIFQAPWRFKDTYPIADGKSIGFELQINAGNGSGSRNGVMVWNNIAHTNYQNVSDYGEAELDADGHSFVTNAQTPTITTQPASVQYDISGGQAAPTLSVTASVTDGGTLTYQWYSNTENSTTNATAIDEADDPSYSPPVDTVGEKFYFVTITNTNNGVDGEKVKTVTSAIAKVEVVDYAGAELVDLVTLVNGGVVAYEFVLPEGDTWGDYTKITADYLVDADNFSKSYNSYRIYGPYPRELFAEQSNHYLVNFNDNTNAPYIFHQDSNNTPASFGGTEGAWFTVTVEFDSTNPNASFSHAPSATDTGPFYFGLGMKPQNGDNTGVTFYVKNVTLSNADGSKKVVSTGSGFDLPAFIGYAGGAFASVKAPDPAPAAE